MFYDSVFFFMFFMSVILLILTFKYMLIVLLMMELIIFNVALIMGLSFLSLFEEFYVIYFLVFSVCESVLGMAVLVLIVRSYGNDLYYFFNIKYYDKIYFCCYFHEVSLGL